MYLAVEIGGTKLQLALGQADGKLLGRWRGTVEPARGAEGILEQIRGQVPILLDQHGLAYSDVRGIGVGYGGPTDDATQRVIKSHHIQGWDNFPLAEWFTDWTSRPCVICNDADVAGLAEAILGAGKGYSPIFYVTVGSGIGGGLIINGEIYRGVGKGAAEVGHVRPVFPLRTTPHVEILEHFASGWGIGKAGERQARHRGWALPGDAPISGWGVAQSAEQGDPVALQILDEAVQALAEGLCTVIKLLCPARIVIGGGVSLIGDQLLFDPLRKYVQERGFAAFAGLTEIVPAALGEDVVLHGALVLADRAFRNR